MVASTPIPPFNSQICYFRYDVLNAARIDQVHISRLGKTPVPTIRIQNLPQIIRRANDATDPRNIFYQAILGSESVEEYLNKVGDIYVVPPTYMERMGAIRELNYMRDNRGWVAEVPDQVGTENDGATAEGFRPDPSNDARTRVLRAVINRQGQFLFRKELLQIYDGRCAVTGCSVQPLLEAAHVTPYLGEHTNVLSNGILLRADIHSLWDLGLLAVHPVERTVHVDITVSGSDSMYAELIGVMIRAPNQANHRPSEDSLRSQWDFFSSIRA